MTPEDAFLMDIIANPDVDGLRLIYADWLDDCGQIDRATFIRVQVELARLSGDVESSGWRQELEARERALLVDHDEEWVGPLRGFIENWTFKRGFVDSIKTDRESFLVHAEDLFTAAPLRCLSLASSWHAPPVKRASVPPSGPLPQRLGELCPLLSRLEEADFSSNPVCDPGIAALAGSSVPFHLLRLGLACSGIGDTGVQAMTTSPVFSRLRSLDLSGNSRGIGSRALEALATSRYLTSLAELDLSGVHIGDEGVEALAASPNLASLTSLNITACHMSGAGARALIASPYLAGLSCLKVGFNYGIGRKVRRALVERFGFPNCRFD
jgi:uncharacterized protein (TIGR02996 family)